MNDEEFIYRRAQWAAFDRVLHLLSSMDTKMINKNDLFQTIMDFRPSIETCSKSDYILEKEINSMLDDDSVYYRADWMTDDQWECAQMFADVVGGFHHLQGTFKPAGAGIRINTYAGGWATWDFNRLTRLVVLAHDRMIRVEVNPSGPRLIQFALWKRHTREGGMAVRHPTMEDAIAMIRPTNKE